MLTNIKLVRKKHLQGINPMWVTNKLKFECIGHRWTWTITFLRSYLDLHANYFPASIFLRAWLEPFPMSLYLTSLTNKCKTSVEVTENSKHTSLSRFGFNYVSEMILLLNCISLQKNILEHLLWIQLAISYLFSQLNPSLIKPGTFN